MPLQRAAGRLEAEFAVSAGRTRIRRLHQAGCLKLRQPRPLPGGVQAEAVLINSSGGLTGGDRLQQAFAVEEGAALTLTTQACERVYRAASDHAGVATRLVAGSGSALQWLPQETILFDGGAVRRTLDVDSAPDARLLLAESVILGRRMMGETVRTGLFRDRWRVRRDGRLVFADDLAFGPGIEATRPARRRPRRRRGLRDRALCRAGRRSAARRGARPARPCGGASLVGGVLVARLPRRPGSISGAASSRCFGPGGRRASACMVALTMVRRETRCS